MKDFHLDWMVITIAAVLNMIIGYVWYSSWLFGSSVIRKKKITSYKILFWTLEFTLCWITAFFLAFFEGYLDVTTVSDGIFVAVCFWFGFIMTTQIGPVFWQSQSIKVFAIHTSYKLLSFIVMGGVIGA